MNINEVPTILIHAEGRPCIGTDAAAVDGGYVAEIVNRHDLSISVPILVYPCECCVDAMDQSTLGLLKVLALRALLKPNDFRMYELARGATTVTKSEASKLLGVGTTRFQELINNGTIPEGLLLGNKRVWLEIELLRIRANIIERDTRAGARRRPKNRFERQKDGKSSASNSGPQVLKSR